ncbi:MAG TPA: shikimate dehydrogenase [Taishania sp.]|nr:shikimate dehydrogenase [Taishania sp.]
MKKYGLIGKTLKHSFSKSFFTEYFQSNSINSVYENIELDTIADFRSLLSQEYCGFNVTIPYKETIIPYLDNLSEEAKTIGAVNCIKVLNGKTTGYNTDAFGFHQSIKPFLTNKHERAIIIGTGGASKAIFYVLKNLGIDCIFISRTPAQENQFGYDEINNHMLNACKLIVNCTPIGMYPNNNEVIQLPFEFLTPDHLVVDLIYNPEKTKLLEFAQQHGAQILNGESMLKQQALKAWEIWNQ